MEQSENQIKGQITEDQANEKVIAQAKLLVDNTLPSYVSGVYPEVIYEAMAYSLCAGGKRLRPLLLLLSCRAFGGGEEKALPFACAVEMIHAYSLIHDDLPAMDDDDYRRGKLTNHKVYGEAMAILAGDGLLNCAYETMAAACAESADIASLSAMKELAEASGAKGMIGGQVADILYENKKADAGALLYIHRHKTAGLISAAMAAGAYLGGAALADVEAIARAGVSLGVAFQIKDDILDVTGSFEQMGKLTQSDAKKGKSTYVTLFGLEQAEEDYMRLSREAVHMVKGLDLQDTALVTYMESLIHRVK